MKWLDEMIDRANAAGQRGEWSSKSYWESLRIVDRLGGVEMASDAVVDLVGCLIDEVERLTRERDALLACRQGEQRRHECQDAGCCDNVTQPQCQACKDTGRITISVGGTALLSHVCECVNRDGKQRE